MLYRSEPLLSALASEVLARRSEWRRQELSNTAWAFARLEYLDGPLLKSLASASISNISATAQTRAGRISPPLEERHVEMALWALSRLNDLSPAWSLVADAEAQGWMASSLALSGPLSACEHRGLQSEQLHLLRLLGRSEDLRLPALSATAARAAEFGDAEEALARVRLSAEAGELDVVSLRLWTACGGGPLPKAVCGTSLAFVPVRVTGKHEKEARLLAHVLSSAPTGNPVAICKAMEDYGRQSLSRPHGGIGGRSPVAGQWLKLAGDEKAKVLALAARAAPSKGITLEVGTYCGYSALRFALARPGSLVLSLEADPGNAVIARTIVAYAGLGHLIDIRIGHSEDVLPQLLYGSDAPLVGLVFFDQRGSRYCADLSTLERSGALLPRAVVVADNCLKPGAPAFLWHVLMGSYETQVIPLEEYAMPGVEDWMTVSVHYPERPASPAAPQEVRRLEWEADQIRSRAEGRPGVGFADWADFVRRMRANLARIGITPGGEW